MAQILRRTKSFQRNKQEIRADVDKIKASGKRRAPHLVAILVGNNGASKAYVNSKVKDCAEVGFKSSWYKFPSTASEAELLEKIEGAEPFQRCRWFHRAIAVPKQMDQEKIIMAIDPRKDVDGFHPENFGKMALEMDTFLTRNSIWNTHFAWKDITVSRPKVKLCNHRKKQNCGQTNEYFDGKKRFPGKFYSDFNPFLHRTYRRFTNHADIVITALGDPNFLKADMIKKEP
jgi:methylenetetrahydrofolate dehydrogenase (NADP+)/methenyltetrahydrofolate cyclohydrolase